jgi:hypothetical protein
MLVSITERQMTSKYQTSFYLKSIHDEADDDEHLEGHSTKNRESGIWLKIYKIIAIPETEILHSR